MQHAHQIRLSFFMQHIVHTVFQVSTSCREGSKMCFFHHKSLVSTCTVSALCYMTKGIPVCLCLCLFVSWKLPQWCSYYVFICVCLCSYVSVCAYMCLSVLMCVLPWQVPFGGSFHNQVQWCAWLEPGSDKVRLQISCDVVFTKKWVPVKNIINSSSIEVSSWL